MSMRTGALIILIVCILLIFSTLMPISWQGPFAGLLSICLALTMVYCLVSRRNYLRRNLNIRKVSYILIHLGFIFFILAGAAGMHGEEFVLELHEQEVIDLSPFNHPFRVRADKIQAEYYHNGLPRQYYTTLSFLEGDTPVRIHTLCVNHPISFRGLYFYQSAYAAVPVKTSILKVKTKPERPYLWAGSLLLTSGVCLWVFGKGEWH